MPKKSKFFVLSVLVLAFSLTLAMADLFSSLLTVGNFAFLPSQTSKTPSYKVYAISLFKGQTYEQSTNKIQEIKLRGGAGFVYSSSGLYYCLASAYENQNDAINVQNSLKEKEIENEIIEIAINEISIDTTFSGKEKSTILEGLNSFKNTFKTMYDLSISLDTSTKDVITCKTELKLLYDKLVKEKENFDNVFKNKLTNEIFQTKLKLTDLNTAVESIIKMDYTDKVTLSSMIKEKYLKILVLNKTLATELS